ncbi:MAG: hypothetical protein ACK40M_13050 [Flavobacteriales bacterium]
MHTGLRIKAARIASGLRQKDLALRVDRSVHLIAYIERTGKISPSMKKRIYLSLNMNEEEYFESVLPLKNKVLVLEENLLLTKQSLLLMSLQMKALEERIKDNH